MPDALIPASALGHDYHADPVETHAGGRVAAALWFTAGGTIQSQTGVVLVATSGGEARAYVASPRPRAPFESEADQARYIAAWGARFPRDAARKLWPALFRRYDQTGSFFPTIADVGSA